MVVAWHPDRIDRGSETLRRQATERMASINEAYRLLCGNLAAKPA
jgi:curved DNA-binding protein CbpA